VKTPSSRTITRLKLQLKKERAVKTHTNKYKLPITKYLNHPNRAGEGGEIDNKTNLKKQHKNDTTDKPHLASSAQRITGKAEHAGPKNK